MSEFIDKKWYVVRAISGQENKIKTFIDNEVKRLNLSNFVEEVIVHSKGGAKKWKKGKGKGLFPDTLWLKQMTGEIPHIIRSFPNILGFLGETKGVIHSLRPAEVSRMLGKVDELAMEGENIAIPFTVGENIKVIDGPFNGFNGNIEKVIEEKKKKLWLNLGRKTPLELSYMQVEKI